MKVQMLAILHGGSTETPKKRNWVIFGQPLTGGSSLTLEGKANAAIARFHKSRRRRRATSAKNTIQSWQKMLAILSKNIQIISNIFL